MLLGTYLIGLLVSANVVYSAKILGLMSVASPSHSLWNTVLVNELSNRGHNVTVLIGDPPKNVDKNNKNLRFYVMEEMYGAVFKDSDLTQFIGMNPIWMPYGFVEYSVLNCQGILKSKGFQKFLEESKNEKYDLILHDYLFGPCLLGFVHVFNYPPLISVSAFPFIPLPTKFIGGHFYPSYIPYHSAMLDPKNNFMDRLFNHVLYGLEELFFRYKMYPKIDNMVKSVYPKGTPPLLEIEKRSVLALVGSHPALTDAHPIPQNVIEIGGLNIIDPKPLEKEFDQFVSSSKKGVVFFSLGTNIRPSDVGEKLAEELVNTMEKYSDYGFMWKFDKSFIKRSIPKNVMIGSFFPQRDILAHPKTKCFITHSGGLGTQESIWYGVPMITIPMLADQIRNSAMMVEEGLAVELSIFTLTGKKFDDALNEILNNPKYAKNIKKKSELFRDRPMKPLDTACWWIDYVLRHPNPAHLKVPTNELGFLVSNSYDVVFTVLFALLLILYIEYKIIVCLCCAKSKAVQDRKKVKKN